MSTLIIVLTLFLTACTTDKLPDDWAPITTVVERRNLPNVSKYVVTTVSPYLFVNNIEQFWERYPDGSTGHEALRLHEVVHAKSQESYPSGKASWFIAYATDKEFRLREEKAGYKAGITHLVKQGEFPFWKIESIARSLSGSVYMNMTTYEEAKAWVEQTVIDARSN